MDGLTIEKKYQDTKIDILKKNYLEEEVVPPTKSKSVTMENKEEKIVQPTHSSKSTSPKKQV
jgi:hypothetical protein